MEGTVGERGLRQRRSCPFLGWLLCMSLRVDGAWRGGVALCVCARV